MASVATSLDPLQVLSPERLRALIQVSHDINSSIDLDVLLPRVLERALHVVDAEAGSLWFVEGQAVRCAAAMGPFASRLLGQELPVEDVVIRRVVDKHEPVLVADAREDDRFLWQLDPAMPFTTRSIITVPLVSRGESLGALQLMNDIGGKDEFDQEDLAFVLALADDAAAALRNASLFQAERRARDLKSLLDVSHEITSTFELERVLVSLVNLAGRAVPLERCVIALWQDEELRVRAISGEATLDRKAVAVRELEAFLLWVAERKDVLDVPDVNDATDADARQVRRSFANYLEGAGLKGFLSVPLRDAEGELGVLHFELPAAHFLEQWNREAAQLLANEAALAIRNAQLYADVPFISWLEPLAQKRRALLALPRAKLLRYAAVATAVVLALILVHVPLRITAQQAVVRSSAQLPVRAAVAGILDAVLVSEGERVAAGQPVALLRNDALHERVQLVEGELRIAEAELLAADGRGDAVAAARARVRLAQLRDVLALLHEERARLRVVAASAGVVLTPRLHEQVGEWREAGAPLMLIGEPNQIEAELQVSQGDIGAVRLGDRVFVRASTHPEVRFEGRVTSIAPLAAQHANEPLYTVRALLDNRLDLLRPGMVARARVYAAKVSIGELMLRAPWRWLRLRVWW